MSDSLDDASMSGEGSWKDQKKKRTSVTTCRGTMKLGYRDFFILVKSAIS